MKPTFIFDNYSFYKMTILEVYLLIYCQHNEFPLFGFVHLPFIYWWCLTIISQLNLIQFVPFKKKIFKWSPLWYESRKCIARCDCALWFYDEFWEVLWCFLEFRTHGNGHVYNVLTRKKWSNVSESNIRIPV